MRRLGPVLVQCINPSPGVFRGGGGKGCVVVPGIFGFAVFPYSTI